jgi:hypothetical protein
MTTTMKNILLASLILFSLSNCSDYLDEKNKSNVLQTDYYPTALGYETLVNSTYASLREVYDVPWIFLAGTDEFVEGRNLQPEGLTKYKNLSSNDTDVANFYTTVYRAIQRCNKAIYYNDKVEINTTFTDIVRKSRLGEVKFLRAYYYFLLVQQFGGVSIVKDVIDNPVVSFKRNTAAEVYDFIIADLEEALTLLPASTDFGRASIPGVKHILAKVHLTRGYESFASSDDFTLAASLADEAINGKALSVSFEDLFWPGKEKNAEVLFSVQFDKTSIKDLTTDGGNQNYWFGPYMGGEGAKNGYPYRSYNLMPTAYVYNLFTENDARWEGTFMNVYYSRYYDFYDKAKTDRPTLNIAYYYPQTWEADTAAWRAADVTHRKKTKIIPYDSTKWVGNSGSGSDNGTPAVRKFDDPISSFSANGSSTRDIYLARLGETYLIAAEAYFKLNDNTTAAARINEVRRRAAKPGKVAEMTIADTDVTLDFILDERGRELLGEYERWFDLKRTGTLESRTLKYNRDIRKLETPFTGSDGKDKILRPIPQTALDLNQDDSFTQNPGY